MGGSRADAGTGTAGTAVRELILHPRPSANMNGITPASSIACKADTKTKDELIAL